MATDPLAWLLGSPTATTDYYTKQVAQMRAKGYPQSMIDTIVGNSPYSSYINHSGLGIGGGGNQGFSGSSSPVMYPEGFQEYLNKLTTQAGNALNGGLLGYQPANLQSANAGGSTTQYNAPTDAGLLGQYAQRPWMKG